MTTDREKPGRERLLAALETLLYGERMSEAYHDAHVMLRRELEAPAPSPSDEDRAKSLAAWVYAMYLEGDEGPIEVMREAFAESFAAVAEAARGEEREAIDGRIQALYDEWYTQEGTQSMRAGLMAAQQIILDRSGPK